MSITQFVGRRLLKKENESLYNTKSLEKSGRLICTETPEERIVRLGFLNLYFKGSKIRIQSFNFDEEVKKFIFDDLDYSV